MKTLKLAIPALLALSLIPTTSSAGICNNASIAGNYAAVYREGSFQGFGNFNFSGTTNAAGQGGVTFTGFENGMLTNPITGTGGVYTFNSSCTLSMAITWHPNKVHTYLVNVIGIGNQLTNPSNPPAPANPAVNIAQRIDGGISGTWNLQLGTSSITYEMGSTIELTRKFK